MTRAAAKRRIDELVAQYSKPWDVMPHDVSAELATLVPIAYPNGIPLPRLGVR